MDNAATNRCCRCGVDMGEAYHCMECDKNFCLLCKTARDDSSVPVHAGEKIKNSASVPQREDCKHEIILPNIQEEKCNYFTTEQNMGSVEESYEYLKGKLREDGVKLKGYLSSTKIEFELIEANARSLVKVTVQAEKTINDQYERLKELIEKHRINLIDELDALKEKRMKKLEDRKEKVKQRLEVLERFVRYSDDLTENCSASAVCQYTSNVLQCTQNMEKSQDRFELGQLGPVGIVFSPTDPLKVGNDETYLGNLIGRLAINEAKDADIRAPVYARMHKITLFCGYRGALWDTNGDDQQLDVLKLIFSMPFNFQELNPSGGANILHSTAYNAEAPLMTAVIKELKQKSDVNFPKMLNERNTERAFCNLNYCLVAKSQKSGELAWNYVEVNRDLLPIFLKRPDGERHDCFCKIIGSGFGTVPDKLVLEELFKLPPTIPHIVEQDQTPLHIATLQDKTAVARILIENGTDVKIADKYGMTPLHIAAMNGNLELVKLLLDHGADAKTLNIWKRTALDVAKLNEQDTVINVLQVK